MRIKKLTKIARRFWADQEGAEVTELAIVLALIVAGAVVAIVLLGPKIKQLYVITNNAIP